MEPASNYVNPHCIDRIFDLAAKKTIVASEDIFDANGNKLWAKGLEITSQLKDRLAQRRLRTPLELSLEIEASITTGMVVDDCLAAIETNPLLSRMAGSKPAQAALSHLRMVNLPGAIRLLLNVTHDSLANNYQNALYTLAISAGFAAKHGLAERETEMLLVTALLHDLGEVYISPEYAAQTRIVDAAAWTAIASHPMLGYRVARDIGRLPEDVTKGIAHHHERLDGSGYPAMLTAVDISRLGRMVGIADAVAAIVLRGEESAAYQTTLALKIIPEEFDRQCVGIVGEALRPLAEINRPAERSCGTCQVRPTIERVKAGESMIQQIAGEEISATAREVLAMAEHIFLNISKALRSIGVEQLLLDGQFGDGVSCAEACDVEREIRWRLRNVSRNVRMRLEKHGAATDMAALQPLFDLLDGEATGVTA